VGLGPDLRLVVFDLDGTLLHLDVDWDRVRRVLGTGKTGETIGDAIARLRLAGEAGDPFLREVTAAELDGLGDRRIDPAIDKTLVEIAGTRAVAVFTRNSREVVARAFADSPLAGRLLVAGREDCTRLKPDPEGLRLLLDRAGVAPAGAVLVGDTYHDVEAARAAGTASIVVHNDRLAYRPDGADRYLDQIPDLLAVLAEDR
jgi:phosphoglycolate phosphatase